MPRFLLSKVLTVILLGALVFFLAISSAFPQAGNVAEDALSSWKAQHPTISYIAEPVGFFNAYSSWLFLSILGLLTLNLLFCTGHRLINRLNIKSLKKIGSLVFHLSLVIVASGGLWSFLTRVDAKIILTEGQTSLLSKSSFLSYTQGPLAPEKLPSVQMGLVKFTPSYQDKKYLIGMSSKLQLIEPDGQPVTIDISVNNPGAIACYAVTQDKFGFSPRIAMSNRSGRRMIDSYMALKTFESDKGEIYTDFFIFPPTSQKLTVTCFPDFIEDERGYRTISELPENPYLLLKLERKDGSLIEEKLVRAGDEVAIGNYSILFAGLRYWSAFRLARDRGIWIIYIGLILSLLGLLMRYWHEMARGIGWKSRSSI